MAQDQQTSSGIWTGTKQFFLNLIDLSRGIDREGTIYEIKNNKRMEGANAWMLMCSIMIASLGLDLSSPAVIIGAMLISPLMSPILGVGLAVATNDNQTLWISLRHFGIAIAIAVVSSTLYFLATPLGVETPEIISRTKPTALDVLVAFFGGIAGIISASRKDVTNAIPGVAIATALMPPLCVTGFGIANGNLNIMLNSFYLFFLNSFFVALATYLIVRHLKFPSYGELAQNEKKKRRLYMILFSFIMIVPSAFILFNVYQDVSSDRRVSRFVNTYFGENDKFIDDWDYVRTDSINRLFLKVYGTEISPENLGDYQSRLAELGLDNTVLEIIPTSEIDLDKFEQLEAQVTGFEKIALQLEETKRFRSRSEMLVDSLTREIEKMEADTISFKQICNELIILFPDLVEASFARAQSSDFTNYAADIPILAVSWKSGKPDNTRQSDEKRIAEFIEQRTSLDSVRLITIR